MTLVKDDLRSYILWRSAECPCLLADTGLLGKTKINLEKMKLAEHERV